MMSNLVLAEDIKHVKILTVFWKSIKLTFLSTQVIKVVGLAASKIQRYMCMCVCVVCVLRFCPRLKRAEKDLWLFTRVSLRLAFQSVGNRIVHSEHSRETVQPSTPTWLSWRALSLSPSLFLTHRWHAYWPQSCVCSLNSDGMLIYRAACCSGCAVSPRDCSLVTV